MIVSCVLTFDFAAGLLSGSNPSLALRLDPLSSDARINAAIAELRERKAGHAERSRELVLAGIRLTPLDARLYSLLAVIAERQGDTRKADRLFDRALALLPTELQALSHKLDASLRTGRLVAASRYLDLIARRWPARWPQASRALPQLASDPAALETLARRFGDSADLRRRLVAGLTDQGLLMAAYDVVLEWHNSLDDDVSDAINRLTHVLIGAGRTTEAYMLFVLTRPDAGAMAAGYVYNGSFERPLSGNPFDWRIASQAGADVAIVDRPPRTGPGADGNESGQFRENGTPVLHPDSRKDKQTDRVRNTVERGTDPEQTGTRLSGRKAVAIRFLGDPVRFRNVSELTRLTPGDYRLSVNYATEGLRMPGPLKLGIRCRAGSRTHLGDLSFKGRMSRSVSDGFLFSVPPGGCGLQQIGLYNEPMPMSWRYRYEGTLYLLNVRIVKRKG